MKFESYCYINFVSLDKKEWFEIRILQLLFAVYDGIIDICYCIEPTQEIYFYKWENWDPESVTNMFKETVFSKVESNFDWNSL